MVSGRDFIIESFFFSLYGPATAAAAAAAPAVAASYLLVVPVSEGGRDLH